MIIKRAINVVIIAVVAWAILYGPAYWTHYTIRQKETQAIHLLESISIAATLRHKINQYFQEYGKFPQNNQEIGVGAPETFAQKKISKVTVGRKGTIEIIFRNPGEKESSVIYRPYLSFSGVGSEIVWQCYSYNIDQSYFIGDMVTCEYREDGTPPPLPVTSGAPVSNSENLVDAIHRKRTGLVKKIIDDGVNVNIKGHGELPLQAAIEKNNADLVEAILSAKADVNARLVDKDNMSMLMLAANKKNIKSSIIKLLLDQGADITLLDDKGRTALMHAARTDNAHVITDLLNAGADIHVQDMNGNTALNHALIYGYNKTSSYYKLASQLDENKDIRYILPDLDD